MGGPGTERDLLLKRSVDGSVSGHQISLQVKATFKYSKTCEDEVADVRSMPCTNAFV